MEKIAGGDMKYWWVRFTGGAEPPHARRGRGGQSVLSKGWNAGCKQEGQKQSSDAGNVFPNAALEYGGRIRERGRVSLWPGVEAYWEGAPVNSRPAPPPAPFIWGVFYMRLVSVGSCVLQNLDLSPAGLRCEATAQPSFLSQLGARLPVQDGR